jgi:hypothetical protein
MTARTRFAFPCGWDIWGVVERWSNIEDAALKGGGGAQRLYQKGRGLMVAPMMYSFTQANGQIYVEAWVRCNMFARLASFFILPAEMSIESGGFKGVLPRKIAREALNRLLAQIGGPQIP